MARDSTTTTSKHLTVHCYCLPIFWGRTSTKPLAAGDLMRMQGLTLEYDGPPLLFPIARLNARWTFGRSFPLHYVAACCTCQASRHLLSSKPLELAVVSRIPESDEQYSNDRLDGYPRPFRYRFRQRKLRLRIEKCQTIEQMIDSIIVEAFIR